MQALNCVFYRSDNSIKYSYDYDDGELIQQSILDYDQLTSKSTEARLSANNLYRAHI